MGNGTNYESFTNNGTVGTVDNQGTFVNYGTTGDMTNSSYVKNYGFVGTVTNTDTFRNLGTIGQVTNTGVLLNDAGAVTGSINNSGAVLNEGTTGAVNNSGVFMNAGTTGTVTNSGTFYFYSGAVSSIHNTGTVDLSVMSGPASLGSSYTQTSTGSTIIDGGQRFKIDGVATLAGNLTILNSPTTIGKYTYLTAGSVIGQFDSLTSATGVLRYTVDGVQLWVMPDGRVVQATVDGVAASMNSMNGLASGSITGMVGSDCSMFGSMGYCVSVNYGVSRIASGDLGSSGVTLAKSINDNWRVGVFGSKLLGQPTVGNIKFAGDTPVGAVIGWRQSKDGSGFGASLSAVTGSGDYTVGSDKTGVRGDAVQAKVTHSELVSSNTTITPYFGVRYSRFKVNGFTEEGPVFPLTYDAVNQTSTDLLAGVSVSRKLLDKLSASVSLGVVHNVKTTAGSVNVSSDMGNFSSSLNGSKHTSAAAGLGMSYSIAKNQSIGFNVGLVQRGLNNVRLSSAGVSYTIGF